MTMKIKFAAFALFAATAAAVALLPEHHGNAKAGIGRTEAAAVPDVSRVEVVFVLDTTGSMSGMIHAAKEKIWSIASNLASARQAPEVRMGLVAFRDRGDEYVTRVVDLSSDLDTLYAKLMDVRAEGGGDTPESVNRALRDAVQRISWSQDSDTYRVIFLVGDSPPHMDYQDEPQYPEILSLATQMGIVVNAIQCGPNPVTSDRWRHIAALGNGQHLQVGQSGSAVAVSTPYDSELAEASRKLDDTRLYYGSADELLRKKNKVAATRKLHESSTITSRARRAVFNASAGGRANSMGEGDLIEDLAAGRVDLPTMNKDLLPDSLRALSPEEQKATVESASRQRARLADEIRQLAAKREAFIRQRVETDGVAAGSLDEKIYGAIREQAAKHGLEYDAEPVDY
jgi:Mg-chelatase subunit ChlD